MAKVKMGRKPLFKGQKMLKIRLWLPTSMVKAIRKAAKREHRKYTAFMRDVIQLALGRLN